MKSILSFLILLLLFINASISKFGVNKKIKSRKVKLSKSTPLASKVKKSLSKSHRLSKSRQEAPSDDAKVETEKAEGEAGEGGEGGEGEKGEGGKAEGAKADDSKAENVTLIAGFNATGVAPPASACN